MCLYTVYVCNFQLTPNSKVLGTDYCASTTFLALCMTQFSSVQRSTWWIELHIVLFHFTTTTYICADQFIGISEWPISWLPGIPLILGCTINSRLLHWLAIYYVKHIKLEYGQSFTSLSVMYHKSVLPCRPDQTFFYYRVPLQCTTYKAPVIPFF